MSELKRHYQRWSEDECDRCGITFQVTRTAEKTVIGELVCSDCELYERAFNDGVKSVQESETKAQAVEEAANSVCGKAPYNKFKGAMAVRARFMEYAKQLRDSN